MVDQTVAELLKDHVTLDLEGIDRLYLNLYQPRLQTGGGVATFFKAHRGAKAISEFFHTKQAGRIRISHLGSSGLRSSLASTSRMAPLVRATPLA